MRIWTAVYHDWSTKGFKHGFKHKRHDCWRGEIIQVQKVDGKWQKISRKRKRFKTEEEARQWVAQGS